jgi:hypothetical protein
VTEDERDKLELIFGGARENFDKLNDFETDFLISMEERYKDWGDRTRISFKQWGVLNRLYDKVVGC